MDWRMTTEVTSKLPLVIEDSDSVNNIVIMVFEYVYDRMRALPCVPLSTIILFIDLVAHARVLTQTRKCTHPERMYQFIVYRIYVY